MASDSQRAFAPPIRLCGLQPRPMRGSISRLSYGFVARPGVHETSVTQPGLFRAYLTDQIRLLIENHGVPVEIGESSEPIHAAIAQAKEAVEALKKKGLEPSSLVAAARAATISRAVRASTMSSNAAVTAESQLLMLWTAPPPARECHRRGCC